MKRIITVLIVVILIQAIPLQAASVIRDGKEWLQPADFVNVSWAQIDAICPATSGRKCTGSLGGINITGFIFASIAEVNMLMATYGVPQPDGCSGTSARVDDSTWAPTVFADFSPTGDYIGARYLEGNVSDADICAGINNNNCAGSGIGFIGIQSTVDLGDGYCAGPGSIPDGVWLYRPAPLEVPTFSTYGLMLTSFGLLIFATRRLARRKTKQG